MARQDTDMVDEVDEAKLAPLGNGEPATWDPSESSHDANVNSREVLETHQRPSVSPDQAMSQYPTTSPEPPLSQDRARSPDSTMNQDRAVSPYQIVSQDPAAIPLPATSQDLTTSPEPRLSQDPTMSPDLAMNQDPAASPVPGVSPCPPASAYQVASQDPAVSPDPGPYENPQPQNPKESHDNVERISPLLGLPFPRKLWTILEDDAFTSVSWNDAGDTVVIQEDLFQSEVLCRRGADQIFETNSLKTFICLLNFHGFSKIRPRDPSVYHSGNNRIMIYRNSNFQRDKPQLIDNIKAKGHLMITAWPGKNATPQKKKQAAVPTRCSLRIQLKQHSKEGNTRAQKTDPNVQEPCATRSFMLPTLWSFGGMAKRARQETYHSETAGLSGEGTSRNVRFVPTATATRHGTGEEPTSFPNYPDYDSVMSLYNTCYAILLAAIPAMAPPNEPEGEEEEEEEEGSSDYKCVFCEHVKDNTDP